MHVFYRKVANMISKNKMLRLLDKYTEKDSLTHKELLDLGFTRQEASKLLGANTIKKVARGQYILNENNTKRIFNTYAKEAISQKDYERAKSYLKRLYEKNEDLDAGFLLLNLKISLKEFDYECFNILDTLLTKNYRMGLNEILLLLGNFIDLPIKMSLYLSTLKVEDLGLKTSTMENIFAKNNLTVLLPLNAYPQSGQILYINAIIPLLEESVRAGVFSESDIAFASNWVQTILKEKNIKKAFTELYYVLEITNKEEYKALLTDALKIDLCTDEEFELFKNNFNHIYDENFEIDIEFYENLYQEYLNVKTRDEKTIQILRACKDILLNYKSTKKQI